MLIYRILLGNGSDKTVPISGKVIDIYPEQILDSVDIAVNETYMISKYGIPNNEFEINYYKINHFVWRHFLSSAADNDRCLIIEGSITLQLPIKHLQNIVNGLPENWDVFFPFDKLLHRSDLMEIHSSRYGFFWGCHIYYISKKGASKLFEIETIRQPLDEEILELSYNKMLQLHCLETNSFLYEETSSPSFIARQSSLKNTILHFPGWEEAEKKMARQLIQLLMEEAERLEIDLVLHGGTLLGQVRHGGIMSWDDDIDFGISESGINKLLAAINDGGNVQCSIIPHRKMHSFSHFYKFWLKEGSPIEGYAYTFPFIDVWVYYDHEDTVSYKEGYVFPRQSYFPFQTINFEGSPLKVPHKPLDCLDLLYQDWRKYIHIYRWCHRLEKSLFPPLKLPIKVDEQGTAIF